MSFIATAVVTGGCIRERRYKNDGYVRVMPMNATPETIEVRSFNETDLDSVPEVKKAFDASLKRTEEENERIAAEYSLFTEDLRYLRERATYSASRETIRGGRVKPGPFDVLFVRYRNRTFIVYPNLRGAE